jgi:hypothetical protein
MSVAPLWRSQLQIVGQHRGYRFLVTNFWIYFDILRYQYLCLKVLDALNRLLSKYRGADKSLARPGKKQATATEDFDVHISYL